MTGSGFSIGKRTPQERRRGRENVNKQRGPKLSRARQLSDQLLEMACLADELAQRGPTRLRLPALTASEQAQADRLWQRCFGLVEETVAFQLTLAPYLPIDLERAA